MSHTTARGERARLGLVLSGGGARGLAHIGVLKVIEEAGIPVDLLVGTSMGGLIAAAYAAGLTPQHMEQEALRMARLRKLASLADRDLPRRGLFAGKRVQEYLVRQLGERTFAELRLPLALVAVDLIRGEEVVLHEGPLVPTVRATVSLPGIFAPLRVGGRLLVDGGVLNHLPVDVARKMGSAAIVAVDVRPSLNGLEAMEKDSLLEQWKGLLAVLRACLALMEQRLTEHKLAQARPEVVIRPTLPPDVGTLTGFGKAAEIIAAGEAAARAALPQIELLLPQQ
jgi:NTE family protein